MYEKPRFATKNIFLVHHFAGTVTYSVSGFMEKNNDALQEDLLALMLCSSNAFIQNAIVATGMSQPGTEGQLGFVAEVPGDKLVAGSEKSAGNAASAGAGEEDASAAATAAYVSNAIAMRKARQAGRRTSMAVMANPEAVAAGKSTVYVIHCFVMTCIQQQICDKFLGQVEHNFLFCRGILCTVV